MIQEINTSTEDQGFGVQTRAEKRRANRYKFYIDSTHQTYNISELLTDDWRGLIASYAMSNHRQVIVQDDSMSELVFLLCKKVKSINLIDAHQEGISITMHSDKVFHLEVNSLLWSEANDITKSLFELKEYDFTNSNDHTEKLYLLIQDYKEKKKVYDDIVHRFQQMQLEVNKEVENTKIKVNKRTFRADLDYEKLEPIREIARPANKAVEKVKKSINKLAIKIAKEVRLKTKENDI